MTDLYLIAHKVRGEPAFDVAERMQCALCAGHGHDLNGVCHECDSLGYWWIIPTSGHRAYPWRYWPWDELAADSRVNSCVFDPVPIEAPPMPDGIPDHYRTRAEPKLDLTSILGLIHKPLAPIKRRF